MTPRLALGGPGPGCSIGRLRRLAAGEVAGEARTRLEEHLAGCARCQGAWAEVEAERRALPERLPFEAFAAGVAEKLARPEVRGAPVRARRATAPVPP